MEVTLVLHRPCFTCIGSSLASNASALDHFLFIYYCAAPPETRDGAAVQLDASRSAQTMRAVPWIAPVQSTSEVLVFLSCVLS